MREYTIFAEDLEKYLTSHWPAWQTRRKKLIASEEGCKDKHAPTYAEAARTAVTDPPEVLQALLQNVRKLMSAHAGGVQLAV